MAKTYIVVSNDMTDEMVNSSQESTFEELFGDYTFIIAESGGSFIIDETESMALIQEYKWKI